MAVEVAVFTPRAPVSLFESEKISLDTVFQSVLRPSLYAEVDARGAVRTLRNTTAVLTAMTLSNRSGSPRTVDIRIRSSRRVTYNAQVTAQAGENWVRINRITRAQDTASIFGYDWSQTPPVRLLQEPDQLGSRTRSVAWTSDSAYLAAAANSASFRVYDAGGNFATAYTSPPAPSPVRAYHCVWSPDDRYLAVTYEFADNITHPFIKVFDFSSGISAPTEVSLPNVATLVTRRPHAIAWGGPGGRYLLVSDAGSARFVAWDWATGSPVPASALGAALSAATAGTASAIAFSTDDRLAVGHSAGDRLTVFNFTTPTTVSKVVNALFSANTQRSIPNQGLAWSRDNLFLAALSGAGSTVPFTVYSFDGGVSVAPAPPALSPLPSLVTLDWSGDGRYLVIGHSESARYTYYLEALPYLLLYDYGSGSPVRITSSPRLQGFGRVHMLKFSPDGDTLIIGGWSYDRFYPPTGVDNVQLLDDSGTNHIVNGSFEDTTGLTREAFGFSAVGAIPNWFVDGGPNVRLYLPNRRFVNAFATDGSVYLDVVSRDPTGSIETSNNVRLRQNIPGLVDGQTYMLSVDVTSSQGSNTAVQLIWNGNAVDISGETVLPIVEDFTLLSLTVPANGSLPAPLQKYMLAYGDLLEMRASGSGVDAVVSYILSTQDSIDTITTPPEPDPEGDLGE